MKFVFIYFFHLCSERKTASAINTWQALSMHWPRGLGQRSRSHGDEVCCQCSYDCLDFLVNLAFFFCGRQSRLGWVHWNRIFGNNRMLLMYHFRFHRSVTLFCCAPFHSVWAVYQCTSWNDRFWCHARAVHCSEWWPHCSARHSNAYG